MWTEVLANPGVRPNKTCLLLAPHLRPRYSYVWMEDTVRHADGVRAQTPLRRMVGCLTALYGFAPSAKVVGRGIRRRARMTEHVRSAASIRRLKSSKVDGLTAVNVRTRRRTSTEEALAGLHTTLAWLPTTNADIRGTPSTERNTTHVKPSYAQSKKGCLDRRTAHAAKGKLWFTDTTTMGTKKNTGWMSYGFVRGATTRRTTHE